MQKIESLIYDAYIKENSELCGKIEELWNNKERLLSICEWKLLQLCENAFDVFMIKQNRN